jgi:hypothetical protein
MLERVKIMRVFDFEGVVEAVEEVKEGLEGPMEKASPGEEEKGGEEKEVCEEKEVNEQVKKPVPIPRKTVIPDSEDEDEDEDEMLLETPIITTEAVGPEKGQMEVEHLPPPEKEEEVASEENVSFVLIDNLAHVHHPLLKEDYVPGKQTP